MTGILEIILTIFGLIGIGYGAARTGLVRRDAGEAVADFVFTIPVPVLVFRTLATADFHDISPWSLWASYFAGSALTWALAHQAVRRAFGRDARAGLVAGMSASYTNIVLIGLPLTQFALGEPGLAVALVILSVHLPIMMAASVMLHEWAVRADKAAAGPVDAGAAARRFARHLAVHPIILAMAAGALWRIGGLGIGGVPAILIDSLATVAPPMALVACGMGIARYGLTGAVGPALAVTAIKLALMPAAVLVLGSLMGLSPVALAAATLIAACPTGVNAYLVAVQLGTGQALSSNALTLSTAISVVTVLLWLAVVRDLLI